MTDQNRLLQDACRIDDATAVAGYRHVGRSDPLLDAVVHRGASPAVRGPGGREFDGRLDVRRGRRTR